jgi:uracil-DNA glycosylase
MSGFFTAKQTESISRPDGKVRSCISCGLYKDVQSPRMKPYGNFKKRILNLGEAPGAEEDRTGKPWQGASGQLLQRTYKKLGIDVFEDCLNVNSCHCRPMDNHGKNRPPTNQEVENCRRTTLKIIKEVQPHIIVLLGGSALYSLLGHRWQDNLSGITKWRGFAIPDQDFNAWLCPTFHPSYIERSDPGGVEEVIWQQDLEQMAKLIDTPLPVYKPPVIEVIQSLEVLDTITSYHIAFDYETTGLKPHATGHRIVCCAVADTSDHAYVFMMPDTRRARQPLVNLLTNPNVGKMAHNMKFEEAWSTVRLGHHIENWLWDSMIAAHILDNRRGITGLKFQSYVNFGVIDYASEIAPYLKGKDDDNANSFNTIFKLLEKPGGQHKLLTYCSYDAVFERRLAEQQMLIMEQLPF